MVFIKVYLKYILFYDILQFQNFGLFKIQKGNKSDVRLGFLKLHLISPLRVEHISDCPLMIWEKKLISNEGDTSGKWAVNPNTQGPKGTYQRL